MRWPRSRLALRIYLAGLLQIAAVLLGSFLFIRMRSAADFAREREARAAVRELAAKVADPAALHAELDRLQREQGATVTLMDASGRVIVSNRHEDERHLPPPHPPPLPHEPRGDHPPPPLGDHPPPPPPDHLVPPLFAAGRPPPMPVFFLPMKLPDGSEGRAVYGIRPPGPVTTDGVVILVIVLVVVGVASLLTARSLARPLERLSIAARAFGQGKLDVRADLARSDEIGEVALAFDEMADRVKNLLYAEKELLANVSHELRTPLSRIRVALEIAEEGDAETARAALADIGDDLGELERLISDVLTAARLDLAEGSDAPGIPPLRRQAVDLRELVEQSAARFRSAHPGRPLSVAVNGDLPVIEGDPVLLRRVFDNLLDNAHKYSPRPEDGIELSARRDEVEARVEVRDHGIGISAEDLPHVFRPFFRADRSRARKTGGLGLGLALARRIVEAHHGTIEIESADRGTRARVFLPVAGAHIR